MPGQRNPLTDGKRIVTMRLAGPVLYATGGNTWTFSVARNVRRVLKLVEDLSAAKSGTTPLYTPIVVASDGQGNTRTVQVLSLPYNTMTWAELGAVNISSINFIATLELAEGV